MTLKYERQWEIIEKAYTLATDSYNYDNKTIDDIENDLWNIKKIIIQKIFDINTFIDWDKLWGIVENNIETLNLSDWIYQKRPLIDTLIEIKLIKRGIWRN